MSELEELRVYLAHLREQETDEMYSTREGAALYTEILYTEDLIAELEN
jgi:hypothetical protein